VLREFALNTDVVSNHKILSPDVSINLGGIKMKNSIDQFKFILANKDKILSSLQLSAIAIDGCYLSLAYIGGGDIPIKLLFELWDEGEMRPNCKQCNFSAYAIGMGGSPLSGSHRWWGYCLECNDYITGSETAFGPLWLKPREKIKMASAIAREGNKEKVEIGEFVELLVDKLQQQ
jgi:hypothetical protein